MKCSDSTEVVKVSQFETYQKNVRKRWRREFLHTAKVEKLMTLKELHKKVLSLKKWYTKHKYQVHNNVFHWPRILATTADYGKIYHMDFSENLTQSYKYEPQSSYFNKQQYSLHCTVTHCQYNFEYLYHLSDEKRHDHAFTANVVGHILHEDDEDVIIRFKSDNCAAQYKCKWVFKYWAVSGNKKTKESYYLLWSVRTWQRDCWWSGLGVKQPLRRAVITNGNFLYLRTLFANDTKKHYYLIDKNDDIKANNLTDLLPIKGCMGLHMIIFWHWWTCTGQS